jgi:hypothetical protein
MEGVIKASKKVSSEHYNDWIEIIDNARIACFSAERDQPLMWSHYADGGRGCVIEFELPKLIIPNKVSYHKKPVWDGKKLDNLNSLELLTYKDIFWRYEREYRVVCTDSTFVPIQVKSVRFGPKANSSTVEILRHIITLTKPLVSISQEKIEGKINPIKSTCIQKEHYFANGSVEGCGECYQRNALIESFSYRPQAGVSEEATSLWPSDSYFGKD